MEMENDTFILCSICEFSPAVTTQMVHVLVHIKVMPLIIQAGQRSNSSIYTTKIGVFFTSRDLSLLCHFVTGFSFRHLY